MRTVRLFPLTTLTICTAGLLTVPSDNLTLGGIAQYQLDAAPAPNDDALAFAIGAAPLTDAYGPIVPAYDAHYLHSGITYGANEPAVADSALIVNGAAVFHGG